MSPLRCDVSPAAARAPPRPTIFIKGKERGNSNGKPHLISSVVHLAAAGRRAVSTTRGISSLHLALPLPHVVCGGLGIRSSLQHLRISTLRRRLAGNLLMVCNCSQSDLTPPPRAQPLLFGTQEKEVPAGRWLPRHHEASDRASPPPGTSHLTRKSLSYTNSTCSLLLPGCFSPDLLG